MARAKTNRSPLDVTCMPSKDLPTDGDLVAQLLDPGCDGGAWLLANALESTANQLEVLEVALQSNDGLVEDRTFAMVVMGIRRRLEAAHVIAVRRLHQERAS
jgi:hypothetical protein